MSGPLQIFKGPLNESLLVEDGGPSFTGVQLLTSTQAIPIPILWGTRRVSPNLIWQGQNPFVPPAPFGLVDNFVILTGPDATPTPGTGYSPIPGGSLPFGAGVFIPGGWQGGIYITGGSLDKKHFAADDSSDPKSVWWVPAIMALCEGPINAIVRMWNGGGTAHLLVNWTGGVAPVGPTYDNTIGTPSLFYTLFVGSSSQTAWGYFAAANALFGGPYYSGQDLTYRFTAYLAAAYFDYGHDNHPPQQSFEVLRTPNTAYRLIDSYGISYDYSPADYIPDLLTNPQYQVGGLVSGDIDATSLLTFKQYCFALGFFFSPLLDSQTPVTDLIDRWAIISNTWIYWDGTVLRFAPLGDETVTGNGQTFTPDTTPAYNLGYGDFIDATVQVDRADPIDCFNRVRIEFCDRAVDYAKNPIEWKDSTLINLYGILDASNIDGQDICDIVIAAKVVELYGKRMAYLRNTYSFTLDARYIRLLPGTIITLTDAALGLNLTPVRVRTLEEDDQGNIKVVAEEYPGTVGLSRPMGHQTWSQTAGGAGGTSTSGGTPSPGAPVSTSGGTLVMTGTEALVLFVAGDVITLPPEPVTLGKLYTFKHDQLRSPQPTPAILEANPVTFQRPASGATYTIEDPSDGTKTPATSVKCKGPSGLTLRFFIDVNGIVRCLQ